MLSMKDLRDVEEVDAVTEEREARDSLLIRRDVGGWLVGRGSILLSPVTCAHGLNSNGDSAELLMSASVGFEFITVSLTASESNSDAKDLDLVNRLKPNDMLGLGLAASSLNCASPARASPSSHSHC